jgi:hypothetical protein
MSADTATLQMNSLAFQNKRCADSVMHLLRSWRENENPTKRQVIEAVETALRELNLSQCQAVYALHQNTDNMHLHICVNRIDPETTKAVIPAGGWTRRVMERAVRRIEHTQGWQTENNAWGEVSESGEVISKPRPANLNRLVPQKVQDMENLTGEQSAIRKAQNILKDRLKGLSIWDVQVNGTDDYKHRCTELAVKNEIRIVNPELQSVQQEIQAKISRESFMKNFLQPHDTTGYFAFPGRHGTHIYGCKTHIVMMFILDFPKNYT